MSFDLDAYERAQSELQRAVDMEAGREVGPLPHPNCRCVIEPMPERRRCDWATILTIGATALVGVYLMILAALIASR